MSGSVLSSNLEINRDMFLNLFITQMRNQNPLDPMDNETFMSQLSQMTSMEQLTNMSSNMAQMESQFGSMLQMLQLGYASGLLGREVTFVDPESGQTITETVDAVHIVGQEVLLEAGTYGISPDAIVRIDAIPPTSSGQ